MLNRRLIRIKVFQAMYAMMQDSDLDLATSLNNLKKSLLGMRDNFFVFFSFPIEFAHYVRTDKNPKERKYISKEEDLRRFEALTFEKLYNTLTSNEELKLKLERPKHNWSTDIDLLQSTYNKVRDTEFYQEYYEADIHDLNEQIKFYKNFLNYLYEEYEEFDHRMEEIEIRWEDEKVSIYKQCIKTLEKFEHDAAEFKLPPLSKNKEEDMRFAEELLTYAVQNNKQYQDLIDKNTPGWDAERIAKADLIFMVMSITEFLNFPEIPPKVTLNEYLELAKKYSTPKSSKFLNGILDRLMKEWKKEGKMIKTGRGLVE